MCLYVTFKYPGEEPFLADLVAGWSRRGPLVLVIVSVMVVEPPARTSVLAFVFVFAFVFLLYLYSARASLLAPCPLSPITSTAPKPRRITCLWFSAPTPLETTSLQSFDPLPKVDLALGHRPHRCKHSQRCREGCQRLTRTWGPANANAWKGRNSMKKWQGF